MILQLPPDTVAMVLVEALLDDTERVEYMIRSRLRQTVERVRERCGPLYAGVCLECGQCLPAPRRWCDNACRSGWAIRK